MCVDYVQPLDLEKIRFDGDLMMEDIGRGRWICTNQLKEKSFTLPLQEPCRPGDEGWPQESTLL